jgi:hypothetical protein
MQMTTFKASVSMIKAAETVFLAMLLVETVRPVVIKYQTDILAEGKWCVRDDFTDRPSEEVILDPRRAWLMSDADFAIYDSQCKAARKAGGLHVDDDEKCPLLVSEHAVVCAESELAEALSEVSPMNSEILNSLGGQRRKDAVELMLTLMAPFVKNDLNALVQAN